jgi:hypothetical protein
MAVLAIPKNMKAYTVGLLYPGPAYDALSDKDIPANVELQAAHLRGVKRCVEQGLQVMAVPVMTPGSRISAMSVYQQGVTPEQAAALLAEDPAIQAGRFVFEVQVALFPSLDCIQVEY